MVSLSWTQHLQGKFYPADPQFGWETISKTQKYIYPGNVLPLVLKISNIWAACNKNRTKQDQHTDSRVAEYFQAFEAVSVASGSSLKFGLFNHEIQITSGCSPRAKLWLRILWTAATVKIFTTASMYRGNMENTAQARTQLSVSRIPQLGESFVTSFSGQRNQALCFLFG